MQGIADLARVKRPVVTMWRSRFTKSANPFPEPVATGTNARLVFDAAAVAAWLEQTGHGNNPDAQLESVLHSDLLLGPRGDLNRLSLLLLLQHWSGETLGELQPDAIRAFCAVAEARGFAFAGEVIEALADDTLRTSADTLAEAAFGGAGVLDRLVAQFASTQGVWREEALTRQAGKFFGELLLELSRSDDRALAPIGIGGIVLGGAILGLARNDDRVRIRFAEPPVSFETPELAVAWRRVAAHGVLDEVEREPMAGCCGLLMLPRADQNQFFSHVRESIVDLGEEDLLIVVGPAPLMIGAPGAATRRQFLVPHPAYMTPLRYAAQLPPGMMLTGGRAQLAIWVFGSHGSEWTVFGDHSDETVLDPRTIAADISAAVSDRSDVRAHAFTRSTVRMSTQMLRSEDLAAILPGKGSAEGGELLARIWENHNGLLDGIGLERARAASDRIPFLEANKQFGRDISGVRIPPTELEAPGPGAATVIGPEEVRDSGAERKRGIHRLRLELIAPRARYTEPGDVIYVAQGGPAAMVDRVGGHIVLAPARVFRCEPKPGKVRQLSPLVVAADICSMRTAARRDWRLRAVAPDQAVALDDAVRRVEARHAELLAELKSLDVLTDALIDGLAEGTIVPQQDETTHPPQHEKAE